MIINILNFITSIDCACHVTIDLEGNCRVLRKELDASEYRLIHLRLQAYEEVLKHVDQQNLELRDGPFERYSLMVGAYNELCGALELYQKFRSFARRNNVIVLPINWDEFLVQFRN